MRTAPRVVMASILTGLVIVMSTSQDVVSQQPPGRVAVAAGYGTNRDALRQWDAAVNRMTQTGDLVVLPLPDGSYALSYRIAMSDGRFYFVAAADGRILHATDAFRSQSAVGIGNGFRGHRTKLSTTRDGMLFQAHDRLRPAETVTLDTRFNTRRFDRLIIDHFINDLPPGVSVWNANDVATDADNDWDDVAVVEAHAHTGWTYD